MSSTCASCSEELVELGFRIIATRGTRRSKQSTGIDAEVVNKVTEGRPDIGDMLKNGKVDFIVNTTEGRQSFADSAVIRRLALQTAVLLNHRSWAAKHCAKPCSFGSGDRCSSPERFTQDWSMKRP